MEFPNATRKLSFLVRFKCSIRMGTTCRAGFDWTRRWKRFPPNVIAIDALPDGTLHGLVK